MLSFVLAVSLLVFVVTIGMSIVRAMGRNDAWKKTLKIAGIAFIVMVAAGALSSAPPGPSQDPGFQRGASVPADTAKTAIDTTTPTTNNDKTTPTKDTTKTAKENQTVTQASPVPLITATVSRVVDGDTIEVAFDGTKEKVRLIGVDTPETVHPSKGVEPFGPEASNYTKNRLDGKTVYLEKGVQERDKYGRLLAYVWQEPPTEISDAEITAKMFNARLLVNGYAQLMTIPPNVKYVDQFTRLQAQARENSYGLWGIAPESVAVAGQTTTTTQAVTPAPQPQATGDVTVYVTNTGKKYHRDGCRYLSKSRIPISLSGAKASGYGPCKVCSPPS